MMTAKQTLRELLAGDKIAKLILQLRSHTEGVADLYDEVLQLSARFERNEQKRRKDLVSNDEVNREHNKITDALLSVINRLPSDLNPPVKSDRTIEPNAFSIKKKITWIAISVIILGLSMVVISIQMIKNLPKTDSVVTVPVKPDTVQEEKKGEISNDKPKYEPVVPNLKPTIEPQKPLLPTTTIINSPPKPKYVKISLEVDDLFSDGDIFVNGKVISPLRGSTSKKKFLEIEYENTTIKLVLKTEQDSCVRYISVPQNYFDNQIIIPVKRCTVF